VSGRVARALLRPQSHKTVKEPVNFRDRSLHGNACWGRDAIEDRPAQDGQVELVGACAKAPWPAFTKNTDLVSAIVCAPELHNDPRVDFPHLTYSAVFPLLLFGITKARDSPSQN
jgi:hypothetical protein